MAKRTALYSKHLELGGKIVDFAGYELPIQYKNGIIHEHNVVRNGVGLFDVSHMGELLLAGEKATQCLQWLVTNKVSTMQEGQCRYALACYEDGGIVDDLLIYKISNECYYLVVNASNTEKDYEWFKQNLLEGATLTNISDTISQLALQGQAAIKVMEKLCDVSLLPIKYYYFTKKMKVANIDCLVSTTGYTGEVGYELYCANDKAEELYSALMAAGEEFGIEPIGLGARDTLRFESSMPLYGHELTQDTIANEVGLDFAVKLKGDFDFIGKDAILKHVPQYERRGLKLIDRGIPREHYPVFDENGEEIGIVTSGGVCPTVGGTFAMARLKAGSPDKVYIDVRGKKILAETTTLPFYKRS